MITSIIQPMVLAGEIGLMVIIACFMTHGTHLGECMIPGMVVIMDMVVITVTAVLAVTVVIMVTAATVVITDTTMVTITGTIIIHTGVGVIIHRIVAV